MCNIEFFGHRLKCVILKIILAPAQYILNIDVTLLISLNNTSSDILLNCFIRSYAVIKSRAYCLKPSETHKDVQLRGVVRRVLQFGWMEVKKSTMKIWLISWSGFQFKCQISTFLHFFGCLVTMSESCTPFMIPTLSG